MEHTAGSKIENMNKVKEAIYEIEKSFTIGDIVNKTKLNHSQCKKYLTGWCEIGIIVYSKTTKIYVRV